MAIPISESISRLRGLLNDLAVQPDGNRRPDTKYRDEDLLLELKRSFQQLLNRDPVAYYPDTEGAAELINNLTLDSDVPLSSQYIYMIEQRAFQTLESREQEGVRPEVARGLNDPEVSRRR